MAVPITQRREADDSGIRFHVLRNSPTLEDYYFEITWDEIEAVAALRNEFEDGSVCSYLEFYTEDGSYEMCNQQWSEGWSDVTKVLPKYLDLRLPDWESRLASLRPTKCLPPWNPESTAGIPDAGKRLLVFLRGSELPPMLQGECDQCGSTYEFEDWP